MEERVRFKTNVQCAGCEAAIKPHLDAHPGVLQWEVDLSHTDRIITVTLSDLDEEGFIELMKKAGYQATIIA